MLVTITFAINDKTNLPRCRGCISQQAKNRVLDLIGVVQVQAGPDGVQELVVRMLLGNLAASDCITREQLASLLHDGCGLAQAKEGNENKCCFVLHGDVC